MKAILLLSGGIDSPVAGYLCMKKGVEITALHMDMRPYSDDGPFNKAVELASAVGKAAQSANSTDGPNVRVPLLTAMHGESQKVFSTCCRTNLTCVLCKRMMLRVASAVANERGADAIVMGDSLGQVASQTIDNLRVESNAAAPVPIIRPLIGMDKEEIVTIAKRIGTFDVSIRKVQGCTFVPERPTTRADEDEIRAVEDTLDMKGMVEKVLGTLKEANTQ